MKPKAAKWRVPVRVDEIPDAGRRFDLHADAATREALARTAGLQALPRLDASFEITRHGRDGVRVRGTVSGTVGQTQPQRVTIEFYRAQHVGAEQQHVRHAPWMHPARPRARRRRAAIARTWGGRCPERRFIR